MARWQRKRFGKGGVALALALLTLAFGVRAVIHRLRSQHHHEHRVTLYAGEPGTTRALVGEKLVTALNTAGMKARTAPADSAEAALDALDKGALDFAFVPSALPAGNRTHVRYAAPLYVEALHLLVKSEFAADPNSALRGRTIDLGPPESATARLAGAIMRFADLSPFGPGSGFTPRNLTGPELEALLARGDRDALPDCVFHIATLPSRVAADLIRKTGFKLVPLPFAAAFRLSGVLEDASTGDLGAVEREDIYETEIPAFTYQTSPPEPPEPLKTLGTRLSLLASDRVPDAVVLAVLDVVFHSSFAHIAHPPLDASSLSQSSRIPFHTGSVTYAQREKPFITDERVAVLSNSLSIIGALAGSALFLWQWRRQRGEVNREKRLADYVRRLAQIEHRAAELERASSLKLDPLLDLQQMVWDLKSEVLKHFAAGELTDPSTLVTLLTPVNATRDHVADLILHIREGIEKQAAVKGTSAEAVWSETMAATEDHDSADTET